MGLQKEHGSSVFCLLGFLFLTNTLLLSRAADEHHYEFIFVPWSDGPEYVTQCPILPGTNFTYQIILSDEIGTIWWHAHSDWTRATVYGAFVILPRDNETYPFTTPDEDHTIILASWYKREVEKIYEESIESGSTPGIPDAYTINGHPGDQYKDIHGCPNDTMYGLQVNYGSLYLLRIINGVMNEAHFFGIKNHNLTVVAQDAAYVKPFTTEYILIAPGQAMDVLVKADENIGRYYMVAQPFSDGGANFRNNVTTAVFEYENSDDEIYPYFQSLPNATDSAAARSFFDRLRSLNTADHPVHVPQTIDKRMYIVASTNSLPCKTPQCVDTRLAASLNNISFVLPSIDILYAYYYGRSDVYTEDFPLEPPMYFDFTGDLEGFNRNAEEGTKVAVLKYGEAVEIIFQSTNLGAGGGHPMHLHGYSFYVVASGLGNFYNHTIDPDKSYNLVDPPEVNTVMVPAKGWTVIRFFANNPGVWFMHCHMERHSSLGMDTVLIVKNGSSTETSMLPPPTYPMPRCPGL